MTAIPYLNLNPNGAGFVLPMIKIGSTIINNKRDALGMTGLSLAQQLAYLLQAMADPRTSADSTKRKAAIVLREALAVTPAETKLSVYVSGDPSLSRQYDGAHWVHVMDVQAGALLSTADNVLKVDEILSGAERAAQEFMEAVKTPAGVKIINDAPTFTGASRGGRKSKNTDIPANGLAVFGGK